MARSVEPRPDDQPAKACPQCCYDLRGQEGDPVRCPECGGQWPANTWAIAPHVSYREDELRATSVAATICGLAGAVCVVAFAPGEWRHACALPLAFVASHVLFAAHFRASCGGAKHWATAYVLCAIVDVLRPFAVVVLLAGLVSLLFGLNSAPFLLLVAGGAWLAAGVLARVARPRLRRLALAWLKAEEARRRRLRH